MSTVVGAILLVGLFVAFSLMVALNWVPVWTQHQEAIHNEAVRDSMGLFGGKVEDRLDGTGSSEAFSHTFNVGNPGLTLFPMTKSVGSLSVQPAPSVDVRVGGSLVVAWSGSLVAATGHQEAAAQAFQYAFGTLEVRQGLDAWVDLRSFLSVERTFGGQIEVSMRGFNISGPESTTTTGSSVEVKAAVTEAETLAPPAGAIQMTIRNVTGDSWRAALDRLLGSEGLTGDEMADCAASTAHYCFATATNDEETVDVFLNQVATGWTIRTGILDVTVGV